MDRPEPSDGRRMESRSSSQSLDRAVLLRRLADLEAETSDVREMLRLADKLFPPATPTTAAVDEPPAIPRPVGEQQDESEPTPAVGPEFDDVWKSPNLAGLGSQDAIFAILTAAGGGWRVPELIEALTANGWESTSDEPATVVRTALQRLMAKGLVVRIGRAEYARAEFRKGASNSDGDESIPSS